MQNYHLQLTNTYGSYTIIEYDMFLSIYTITSQVLG